MVKKTQVMKQTWTHLFKWLLPVLFIAYIGDISLFLHVHVQDGVTIVHSHPFKKKADAPVHHHNSFAEIQLFHELSAISTEDGAVHPLTLSFYSGPVIQIETAVLLTTFQPVQKISFSLRAPPALLS